MLTRVEVKPGEYHRYKSPEDFVPPGIYYKTSNKLDGHLKSGLRVISATHTIHGGFARLLPYEPWVKRILDQWEPPAAKFHGAIGLDEKTVAEIVDFYRIKRDLWDKLRPWQQRELATTAYLAKYEGADHSGLRCPMGGGKTLFGLIVMNAFPDSSVVVARKHLWLDPWCLQAEKFGFPKPRLVTWHSADKIEDKPQCVILDEALEAMNPTTDIHADALKLCSTAKVALGWTATPCSTRPHNWRWLRAISHGCVPDNEKSWMHFFGIDVELKEVAPGKKAYGCTEWDTEAVARFVKPYVRSVSQAEVDAELPPVQQEFIRVPKPPRYETILKGGGTERGAAKRLAQARQASDGFFYDDLGDAVELHQLKIEAKTLVDSTEEAVVLYAAWDWTVDKLASTLSDHKPAVLKGGSDYAQELNRFLTGETRVLIANARISTGLKLQERCHIMAFLSCDLFPVNLTQAIGRIVRPGQQHSCLVYFIVAEGTLDERIIKTLQEHQDLSAAMVEELLSS